MSKTVSTCASQTEQGTHVFRIIGYSGIGDCKLMKSDRFTVGGHDWKLLFMPNASVFSNNPESTKDRSTIALSFRGKEKAHASFELRLLDQIKGVSVSVYKKEPRTFDPDDDTIFSACSIKRDLLKALAKDDDCLTVECTVTVYKHPKATQTKSLPRIQVPQSDMAEHFKDACIEFITCSNAMEAVVKTEGYKNLKRSCPSVAIEALEKTSKSRKA